MQHFNPATIPTTGRHLIEASAGTGKTFGITRLYLRLIVESGLSVEQILVMTFTKAATHELRGRLHELIQLAYQQWDTLDEAFFVAMRERVPSATARARLSQALVHLDQAAVYTIHGFCKRALTQEAFASGISFVADMEADSYELSMEALRDWYRREATGSNFETIHGYWPTPDDFQTAWANLLTNKEPLDSVPPPDLSVALTAFASGWPDEADAFSELNVQARRGANKAVWQEYHDELCALAQAGANGQVPECINPKFRKDAFSTGKKIAALPALNALIKAVVEHERQTKAYWANTGIQFTREHVDAAKIRLSKMDFNDLILRLREALEGERGEDLAQVIAAQFPAALVDEFQDTDPDQYAILNAVYKPREDQPSYLAMIGDPKQAIYGFRGGDVFAYLQARVNADEEWAMNTNYRSNPELLTGYNRLFFGRSLDNGPAADTFGFGIDYLPVEAGATTVPGPGGPTERTALTFGLLPSEPDAKRGLSRSGLADLARWTSGEILRLLDEGTLGDEAVQPSDIAILVRDRNEAALMQDALREVELSAVYLSARESVFQTPEAEDLYRLMRGVLYCEDERALVAAAASSWYGFTVEQLATLEADDAVWARVQNHMAQLRDQWLNQGFMPMALSLFSNHLTPAHQRHNRALSNGTHLMERIQEASHSHKRPFELLHWYEDKLSSDLLESGDQVRLESDANLVQIITHHGSKGLQYPIVFLPFISYGRSPAGTPDVVRYHDRSTFSVRTQLSPSNDVIQLYEEEQAAEDIRLLYVAATRAESHLYLLAGNFDRVERSSLARCLKAGTFGELTDLIEGQANELGNTVVDLSQPATHLSAAKAEVKSDQLQVSEFTGHIERDWHLSSFSALARGVSHAGPAARDRDDSEPESAVATGSTEFRFTLAKGAEAGNLVHDVLERLDFVAPDFELAMAGPMQRYGHLLGNAEETFPQFTAWLTDVLSVELPSGVRMADLDINSTLREPEFYFPMAATGGGIKALAEILAAHRGVDSVALPDWRTLKGMMHGFIDLVYEVDGRFYLSDYKSNFLGDSLLAYDDQAMMEAIQAHSYDLQYLLYTLALHRYLKQVVPDYSPKTHLGGFQYLFVRGMAEGQTTGVYHRSVDFDALEAMDHLFRGESPMEMAA